MCQTEGWAGILPAAGHTLPMWLAGLLSLGGILILMPLPGTSGYSCPTARLLCPCSWDMHCAMSSAGRVSVASPVERVLGQVLRAHWKRLFFQRHHILMFSFPDLPTDEPSYIHTTSTTITFAVAVAVVTPGIYHSYCNRFCTYIHPILHQQSSQP